MLFRSVSQSRYLVLDNFKKFCGEQATTGASTNFTLPVFTAYNPVAESLSDYMGIPPLGGGATVSHVSLWHRAYNLIWNEWFRDQNLQDSVTVDKGDGPDSISNYVLLKRGKRHDYFTSCLPWTSKNNTGTPVSVGLAGLAPVTGIGKGNNTWNVSNVTSRETGGGTPTYSKWFVAGDSSANNYLYVNNDSNHDGFPAIYADLSAVSGITINALRLAFQTQKMYERDARGGTRYREIVQSHFGVLDPNDARLQRPEYLGGGTSPVVLTPVPQTSVTRCS